MSQAVLIIEDEVVLARKVAKYLQLGGYETHVARAGEEDLVPLPSFQSDVTVLGSNLPGIDDLECLRRLSAQAPGLPVIMVTGDGNERVAVDAMIGAAFDYLSKPVVLSELARVVDAGLSATRRLGRDAWQQGRSASVAAIERLTGDSAPMRSPKADLSRTIAATATPRTRAPSIRITGETDTGKQLVDRALHFDGARAGNITHPGFQTVGTVPHSTPAGATQGAACTRETTARSGLRNIQNLSNSERYQPLPRASTRTRRTWHQTCSGIDTSLIQI